jgi:hypothetical protein
MKLAMPAAPPSTRLRIVQRPGRVLMGILMCTAVTLSGLASCKSGPNVTTPTATPIPTIPAGVGALATVTGSRIANAPSIGFSIEANALCEIEALDAVHRASFEALFRQLGPGVIHISGHSTDSASWRHRGQPVCSGNLGTVITSQEIAKLFALAHRVGWRVLWELPLIKFNPKLAATEASYIASVSRGMLLGWTIGNEPDIYASNFNQRPPSWDYAKFYQQWNATRKAVVAKVPKVPVIGPETCCNAVYFNSFAVDARKQVTGLSFHFYAASTRHHTVPYLLGPMPEAKLHNLLSTFWSQSAEIDHLPLYLSETNTFSGGGAQGISDRYAALLYLTDLILYAGTQHVSAAYVQQSAGSVFYNAIDSRGSVGQTPQGPANATPVYYALRLYRDITGNAAGLLNTRISTKLDVNVYAVRTANGGLTLTLVNKSPHSVVMRVNLDHGYSKASRFTVEAPQPRSGLRHITIGGKPISRPTSWPPKSTKQVINHKTITVTVPARALTVIKLTL